MSYAIYRLDSKGRMVDFVTSQASGDTPLQALNRARAVGDPANWPEGERYILVPIFGNGVVRRKDGDQVIFRLKPPARPAAEFLPEGF